MSQLMDEVCEEVVSKLIAAFAIILATTNLASAHASGPTNTVDPPSPKDGQFEQFQLLTETACVNGHFAGESAPSIAVIPPSLRPPEDRGAPGYRIFISCAEGYVRTTIWNPGKNVYPTPETSPAK
jgi:hypothetical protein